MFMAWRIRIITQSRIPALVIAVFSLTAMGMFISRVVPDLTISLSWRDLDDGLGQSSTQLPAIRRFPGRADNMAGIFSRH